jgi:hypothetical protein
MYGFTPTRTRCHRPGRPGRVAVAEIAAGAGLTFPPYRVPACRYAGVCSLEESEVHR